jgi:hypothetical protein
MKKIIKYLLPSLFLLAIVGIVWFIFILCDIVTDPEKRLTGIIAILGLGFGVFQFWVTEINTRSRRTSELRYNEYRQLFILIESIPDFLNIEMMKDQSDDPHGLVSTLMNQINRISSLINTNNEFLFPGLIDSEESKNLNRVLSEILRRSDILRDKIEKTVKKDQQDLSGLVKMIESMNWHNDIKNQLDEYHSVKYDFYKKLRNYK